MKIQKNKLELSLVVPVFNEEENLPFLLEELKKIAYRINVEVLLVEDGGSTDNTQKIIKEFAKKYKFIQAIIIKEKGYGKSIYEGLKFARADYIGWTHGDRQMHPTDVLEAIKIIKGKNYPKFIYIKGKRYGRPITDKLVNTLGMSLFETFILRKWLYDINAQPNIFHKSLLEKMKNPPVDFSFDLYTYYLAKINKYDIVRFPVFFGKRIFGESAWDKGWKERIKFIKRTIKFTFELKKRLRKDRL